MASAGPAADGLNSSQILAGERRHKSVGSESGRGAWGFGVFQGFLTGLYKGVLVHLVMGLMRVRVGDLGYFIRFSS